MADFREAWRELDFTAIFAAMTEAHSRVQFMEELYGAVLGTSARTRERCDVHRG